jgi:hypothetical protein
MSAALVSELDPAAEANRLEQWAASYGTSGGPGGLLAPGRADGERWLAVIRGVGRDEIDQRDLADPGVLLGHGSARNPAHQAWVSAQRVVFEAVFAAQRGEQAEWIRDLPLRLSRIVRRAQDAEAG